MKRWKSQKWVRDETNNLNVASAYELKIILLLISVLAIIPTFISLIFMLLIPDCYLRRTQITALSIYQMADAVRLDSSEAIPRTWRILIYTISILGFGNVAMFSWLPAKLRTATVVYHGFSLPIHTINAIIFLVGIHFTGPLFVLLPKLYYFS